MCIKTEIRIIKLYIYSSVITILYFSIIKNSDSTSYSCMCLLGRVPDGLKFLHCLCKNMIKNTLSIICTVPYRYRYYQYLPVCLLIFIADSSNSPKTSVMRIKLIKIYIQQCLVVPVYGKHYQVKRYITYYIPQELLVYCTLFSGTLVLYSRCSRY